MEGGQPDLLSAALDECGLSDFLSASPVSEKF